MLLAPLRLGLAALFALALLLPATARADKQTALREYKEGRKAYDLGRFEAAIAHFEAAYEARPAPEFVFNIAQAYRQLGKCHRAIFFYRRFLRLDPDTKARGEIEGRIAELEPECTGPEPLPETDSPPPPPPRRWLAISFEAGLGIADIGDLDVPVQPSFRLGLAVPLTAGAVELRVGALGTLLPVPYEGGTALLGQALGHAELSVELVRWLRLRAEAGVGAMFFGGLDAGNPFTVGNAAATGALTMFAVRVGGGIDVPVSPAWRFRLTAASLSYSPPKDGLDDSIDRLLKLEVTGGIGVTF